MNSSGRSCTKGTRERLAKASLGEFSPCHADGARKKDLDFPTSLVLTPILRSPTTLPQATVEAVLRTPLPEAVERGEHRASAECASRASVVVVTFDNLVFNRLCLESVLAVTAGTDAEIVVVDNGSSDGTREYLKELERRQPRLRAVFNSVNRGFAAANNQAIEVAAGEAMVLLNNDTIVPPGALERLLGYLDDETIGLVGPVTNRCGNEAQVEAPYQTLGEMLEFAEARAAEYEGQSFDIRVATMFCVAMRREVFAQVGKLDEQFGIGLFEDDDYSMQVRAAGYRVVCAEDVFVHHFGQASLGKLASAGQYGELFHANRRRWEAKWQMPWQPYARRPSAGYLNAVARIRELVERTLTPNAAVAVVSNGDDELLDLGGCRACHFPQDASGGYAGYHPADSDSVIEQLELLRAAGIGWLVLPAASFWWLDYYPGFAAYLNDRCSLVVHEPEVCRIFALQVPE